MSDEKTGTILRGASTHAQPRHLSRAPRRAKDIAMQPARDPGFDEGFQQGVDEGRAAGMQQGLLGAQQRIDEAMRAARQEFEQVARQRLQEFQSESAARLSQLDRLLAGFEKGAARRLDEVQDDAVALAYGAVCKLLGERLDDGAVIAGAVGQAMAQLRGSKLIAVRMNEADLRSMFANEQGGRLRDAAPQVDWIADSTLTMGGCVIDTASGSLDARLDTQLQSLRALWATKPRPVGPSA